MYGMIPSECKQIQKNAIQDNKISVNSLLAELKICTKTRNLECGKQIHAKVLQCGVVSNIYLANSLIHMYARCGSMANAVQVFENLENPNVVAWNTLILGYVENGQGLTALDLFTRMKDNGPKPDSVTFVAGIKAFTSSVKAKTSNCMDHGRELHKLADKNGCGSNVFVQSTLIDMYANGGNMKEANEVFQNMKHPNVVSWTALILGYAENGQGSKALDMFTKMKRGGTAPNHLTIVAALRGCTALAAEGPSVWPECLERGRELHQLAVENGYDSNIYIQSTLVDMYAKCGNMTEARQVFDSMAHRDAVSWTALILGYADNGKAFTAMELFMRMRKEGPAPDSVTFAAALKVCSLLGALEFGRKIHLEIGNGELNVILVNCLVDFYVKCGDLVEAQRVFELYAATRNLITWNAFLAGFSSCGDETTVFKIFEEIQSKGLLPDSVTFLSILACCSHAGHVEKGKECFNIMSTKYGIIPNVGHYNCMADIFGRANQLDNAMSLLKEMHCNANDITWTTVLDACRKWKNVDVGRLAFQSLMKLNDEELIAYALMGQIFGSRAMLQEQGLVEMMMRKKGLKTRKLSPETYWTNHCGVVHLFSLQASYKI